MPSPRPNFDNPQQNSGLNSDKLYNPSRLHGGASALSEKNEDSYSYSGMRPRQSDREHFTMNKEHLTLGK